MYITYQVYDHTIAIPLEVFNSLQSTMIFLKGYGSDRIVVPLEDSGFELSLLEKLPEPEDETAKIFKQINQLTLDNARLQQQLKELKQLYEDK